MNSILVGGIVEGVSKVADDLFTSDEERLAAELELTKEANKLPLGQIEINKVEAAHQSIFVAGWRPAVGWTCVGGLVYQVMFRPVFGWVMVNIAGWSEPPNLELETLMTLLFGLLGLGGYRTYEKVKKVQ